MMEALRFPWEEDDKRREVAPSAFRPRSRRTSGRAHASRQPRKPGTRRRPSLSRTVLTTPIEAPATRQTTGHASREAARDRTAGRVVKGPQRERHEPDYMLMAAAVALSAIGILMVYSSTGHDAATIRGGSIFDDVSEQLAWALLGGLVLIFLMRIDYRYWRTFSILGVAVSIVLLVLVVGPSVPPLLEPLEVNGATRWLKIGGLPSFQPTEIAKLALVIFLAHWLSKKGKSVSSLRGALVPFVLLVSVFAGLILLEPDLGTTGVIVLTAFAMFFVAGGSIWQLALMVPIGVAAVAGVVAMKPYMLQRVTIFMDPFADPDGAGYQTFRSINSLAYGGITGKGLGFSQQPAGWTVPAAENDFIFAVVGQEFGFLGGLLVIGLFLLLAWRGIRVALKAPDTFGGLLALGITSWLVFQAFINIAVVVNLIPMTGMPLPFLSKGGTSLVVVLAAVGILLSISRESVTRGASAHEDPHRGRGHRRPHLPRPGRRDPAADQAT
ncbi:MAG: putative lipid II flippase FtsW [Candidatus Limnocylindrales bacterium]